MTLEEYKPSSVKSMIVEQPAECDSTPAHSGKICAACTSASLSERAGHHPFAHGAVAGCV